jgi:hypothetical protein
LIDLTRLRRLAKSLHDLERFQRRSIERIRIEIETLRMERHEQISTAERMLELMPGNRSFYRRLEDSKLRLIDLDRRMSVLQNRLVRTRATQRAVAARLDQLAAVQERREQERAIESYLTASAVRAPAA